MIIFLEQIPRLTIGVSMIIVRLSLDINTNDVVKAMKKLPEKRYLNHRSSGLIGTCKHFLVLLISKKPTVQQTPQGCAICSCSSNSRLTIVIRISAGGGGHLRENSQARIDEHEES